MSMTPLTGSAGTVDGHGTAYANTARAIRDAVQLLREIRDDSETISKAVDEVRSETAEVSDQIELATERYEVTGQALREYASELLAAQQQADDAIEAWQSAHRRLAAAESARAAADDDADSSFDDAVDRAHAAIAEAEREWQAASSRKDDAGGRAADMIRRVVADAEINDSLWDDFRGFFAEAGDWLTSQFTALMQAIGRIATQLGVILAGVALALAGILALTSGAWLLGLLLIGGGLAAGLAVFSGGVGAFYDSLLATGSLQRALQAGLIKSLTALLPWAVEYLVDADAVPAAHKARVDHDGRVDLSGMTAGEVLAWLQEANVNADQQAGIPVPAGLTNDDSTMITIHEVIGPDGTVRFIVTIPSTQAWTPGTGAANDISSGVASKFGDGPTQLQLAVQDAMVRAGIEPGDSILLSGWSLGGITAGELAANPDFAAMYDIDGVVVSGSGIDDIAIPSHIPVLQFEHLAGSGPLADPVPGLVDPDAAYRGGDVNRTKVQVPPPADSPWLPHSGSSYGVTVQQQGDLPGSSAEQWVDHNLGDYFGDGATGTSQSHFYQRDPGPVRD